MNLAIVGSRNYTEYAPFALMVDSYIRKHGKPNLIISGGASGIDSLAARYAEEHGIIFREFPADWAKYGRYAGPLRNTQIVEAATHLLAMPSISSIGTHDTIKKATRADLNVTIVRVEQLASEQVPVPVPATEALED